MSEPRSDYRLSFVWSNTGRPIYFADIETGRGIDPSRTCRNFTREGMERHCAKGIAEIARRSGIDPTRIEGRITELDPKRSEADPIAAALLGAN